jgi:hypothetical protein
VLVAALPLGLIAQAVATHARNLPWWDQWGLVPFMVEATQGRFPPALLWAEVNEHRIPVALLLQGVVAWWTRWDVRGDAWTNVAVSTGTLVALAALVRRTIAPSAPAAAPWLVVVCSALVFSPIAGVSWTAGWITPVYLAAMLAAVVAWTFTRPVGWPWLTAAVLAATAGALAFGSGMMLVLLVPVAALATPGRPARERATQALAAGTVAAVVLLAYFHDWHPRAGFPPPVFHADRIHEYVLYALGYVGGSVGARDLPSARLWGAGLVGMLATAAGALWQRRPDLRGALVPWAVLAVFGIGNGFVTAYGRIDNGAHTALLPRYVPTTALFAASVAAVMTLAIAALRAGAPRAAAALAAALVLAVAAAQFARAASAGLDDMARLARRLDAGRACLVTCATATDGCLASICWSSAVARQMCPVMEAARIGPFRETASRPPA